MAGVKFDGTAATASLRGLLAGIENPAPLLAQLGEYTLRTTRDRFKTQTGPDGTAWAALQPWYKKEKSQNKNRVLTLRGFLRGQLVSQVVGGQVRRGGQQLGLCGRAPVRRHHQAQERQTAGLPWPRRQIRDDSGPALFGLVRRGPKRAGGAHAGLA